MTKQVEFKSSPVITRHPANPVLKAENVPYDAALVFNAGIVKWQGRYVMVFRNDYDFCEEDFIEHNKGNRSCPQHETNIGIAFSNDGVNWEVERKPFFSMEDDEIHRAYDPRLTIIDDKCYLCFAVDTSHGVRGGVASVSDDFSDVEVLSLSAPDNRNMVLFPEKIGEKYVRLERPFPVYGRGGGEAFDIWMSSSPDLRYWGDNKLLLGAESVSFCNCKLGPAAPPVKTDKGWLTTFHAVWKDESHELNSWHKNWHKAYLGGIMLLDLEDPSKIIGMCETPLLAPETDYERKGFRGDVIFPGGMILEDSGEVKIYYGAADTVECLATADVNDLLELCL